MASPSCTSYSPLPSISQSASFTSTSTPGRLQGECGVVCDCNGEDWSMIPLRSTTHTVPSATNSSGRSFKYSSLMCMMRESNVRDSPCTGTLMSISFCLSNRSSKPPLHGACGNRSGAWCEDAHRA